MMKVYLKDFFIKYYVILLGLLIFTTYFWSRFLRTKESKDLPLELSLIRFFILINLCCVFVYIIISIISIIYPRKPNVVLEQITEWLFIPFVELDKYFKSFPKIRTIYDKLINFITSNLEFLDIKQANISRYIFRYYLIFWVIPRLILLFALLIDIILFNQLYYKYKVILFSLILFINRYCKFSLKTTKKDLIEEYAKSIDNIFTKFVHGIYEKYYGPNVNNDDDDIPPTMSLKLEYFVDFQTTSIVYQNIIRSYIGIFSKLEFKDTLWEEYTNTKRPHYKPGLGRPFPEYQSIYGDFKATNNFIEEKIDLHNKEGLNKIIKISLLLEYYNQLSNLNKFIKIFKIIIYSLYLICWIYILTISIHTLNITELWEFLDVILNNTRETLSGNYFEENLYDEIIP